MLASAFGLFVRESVQSNTKASAVGSVAVPSYIIDRAHHGTLGPAHLNTYLFM